MANEGLCRETVTVFPEAKSATPTPPLPLRGSRMSSIPSTFYLYRGEGPFSWEEIVNASFHRKIVFLFILRDTLSYTLGS